MKKTLIALAAVAVSSAAMAQVTISGGLVLGVGTTKTGATSSGTQIVRQTGNIAFSGTEDLGNGLKASFRVETTVGTAAASNVDNTADDKATRRTLLGDRGAFLALQGGFGNVVVGRAASGVRANFGAVGDVSRLAVVTGLSNSTSASDAAARVIVGDAYSNQVAYQTPTISGFSASVGVAPVEGKTADKGDTMSYGLNYAAGPLAVRVNLTDTKPSATPDAAATAGNKLTTINASYDLGVAKIGFTSQTTKVSTGVKPGNATAVTANIPMGAGSIGLGWGEKKASAATQGGVGGDEVKQMFVGYRHDLSKRTHVQAIYNKIDRQGATITNDVKEAHILIGHSF